MNKAISFTCIICISRLLYVYFIPENVPILDKVKTCIVFACKWKAFY